jgi:hypothetical protein
MQKKRNFTADSDLAVLSETSILFLVPLVQTAWSHGAISPREKQLIFDAAREDGIDERHQLNDVLDRWLVYQPSTNFFDDCLTQISELMRLMTVKERDEIRTKILSRCRSVAETAGGKSRMDVNHHISREETELLAELQEILK